MSPLNLFLFVFVFLLIIGGWVTSEIISSRTTRINKKFSKQMSLMERESNKLQLQLTKETNRYTRLKEDYDEIKEAKAQIRIIEADYNKLLRAHTRLEDGIEILRKKTTSKKYSSNSLAKEVIVLLDEYSPTVEQREKNKTEDTQNSFKRIKSAMGMGDG